MDIETLVLILIVVDDGLVPIDVELTERAAGVLILIVVDDGLVLNYWVDYYSDCHLF